MEFGDMLKAIRKERGLSQDELASILGTTKQVISRYETKQRVPRLSVVADYAEKLGVPLVLLSGQQMQEPVRERGVRRVPVIGSVACGEPIYKPGDGTDFATIEEGIACDFALIAQGDSMTGDRIHSGDLVFIRRQDSVRDGEIAAVALDDELTLKRVRRILDPSGRVAFTQLMPSNPRYAPITIGGAEETRNVSILGKAVAVRFMI
ncbi:MAG: LexA family protein [Candidatus Ventricola sp.]